MKFPMVAFGTVGISDRVPQERMTDLTGPGLIESVDREQSRPHLAHAFVVREENVERAECLHLNLTGSVVPVAEQRPDVTFNRRREIG